MKTGFNLLLWTTHVTAEHTAILKGIKKAGYDTVEIPVFEGTPEHFARLGDLLDKLGLERSVVSVIGPSGKNPTFGGQGGARGGGGLHQMGDRLHQGTWSPYYCWADAFGNWLFFGRWSPSQ